MALVLSPHPDTPCPWAERLEAHASLRNGLIHIRYALSGALETLKTPAPAAAERCDGLWRATCFEAFLRAPSGAYVEFNFAPSTQWAAYAFDAYRENMRDLPMAPAPRIAVARSETQMTLEVAFDCTSTQAILGDAPWAMALTAVLEDSEEKRAYWALRHPPGQPDFHHADGFAAQLINTDIA